MITKIMASVSLIGVMGLAGYEYMQTLALQQRVKTFVNQGACFTAEDGKELCEYINTIAQQSIGFQQSGLPMLDCKKYARTGIGL